MRRNEERDDDAGEDDMPLHMRHKKGLMMRRNEERDDDAGEDYMPLHMRRSKKEVDRTEERDDDAGEDDMPLHMRRGKKEVDLTEERDDEDDEDDEMPLHNMRHGKKEVGSSTGITCNEELLPPDALFCRKKWEDDYFAYTTPPHGMAMQRRRKTSATLAEQLMEEDAREKNQEDEVAAASLHRKNRRLSLVESSRLATSHMSSEDARQVIAMHFTQTLAAAHVARHLCRDTLHGESMASPHNNMWMHLTEDQEQAVIPADVVMNLDTCKNHVHSIAFCMEDHGFPADAHTVEVALSICICAVLHHHHHGNGKISSRPFVDDDSMIMFSAACFTIACKFCQSVVGRQMQVLADWIREAQTNSTCKKKRVHCMSMASLFNMEVRSICDA